MNNMNKYLTFLIGCVTILACDKTVEPQMLFENIPTCCQLNNCDKNNATYKSLRSDTILILNVKGTLYDGVDLKVTDLNNNIIDPKRFPSWAEFKGLLYSCNLPRELLNREAGKYWEVEMDLVIYYFFAQSGYDYGGYPADIKRIKLVKQLKL
jgi:uncharacterized protein YegJ (DUF2314 family)